MRLTSRILPLQSSLLPDKSRAFRTRPSPDPASFRPSKPLDIRNVHRLQRAGAYRRVPQTVSRRVSVQPFPSLTGMCIRRVIENYCAIATTGDHLHTTTPYSLVILTRSSLAHSITMVRLWTHVHDRSPAYMAPSFLGRYPRLSIHALYCAHREGVLHPRGIDLEVQ